MHIQIGEQLDDLAVSLAGRLAAPLADPMTPEVIVVPTSGMQRWLALELSRRLGTSGEGRGDGIAANIEMIFPGRLTQMVLDPGDEDDPWELEAVAWVLLEILTTSAKAAPDIPALAPGATEWARARRLADLFDRYMTHRPEMIRAWARGEEVDGSGKPIENRVSWQPRLWRSLRGRVGVASPPENLPTQIEALRGGQCPSTVPDRVSLFGLTTIPGGASFLELLEALGTQRDIGLFLHQPSKLLATRIRAAVSDAGPRSTVEASLLRTEDDSATLVSNPLLRSWGRSARETMVVLSGSHQTLTATTSGTPMDEPSTILEQFQADLRADHESDRSFEPPIGSTATLADNSIRIHSCHGNTRQVEVLRDQILHLLAEDPTLTEEDIVVLCPALERFAPTIESVFGPSVERGRVSGAPQEFEQVPALRYRLSDRSLGSTYPLLGAMGDLVELLASRFSDQAVVNFVALPAVRRRFGFDDEALEQITRWVSSANVRWGMDGSQRQRWRVPAAYTDGTFLRALDRLMAGITSSNDQFALAQGQVAPIAVEGNGIVTAGKLASLLSRLAELAEVAQTPKPVADWLSALDRAATEVFQVDPDRPWERQRLSGIFERIAKASAHRTDDGSGGSEEPPERNQVLLTLADVRHLIGDQLGMNPGRPGFFRGGVTISTPTPLRGVPHRVVCMLGMDETAFSSGTPDGDDLMAADPHLGDRDKRADMRQVLLDSALAARDHLILLRNGKDVVTNQEVPPAVVVAEITETLGATVTPASAETFCTQLTTVHPRQRFDERNFISVEHPGDASERQIPPGTDTPWSFDPLAMHAATARRSARKERRFIEGRVQVEDDDRVTLDELHSFLANPARYFLEGVLQISLPDPPEAGNGASVAQVVGPSGIPSPAPGRDLLLELDPLDSWKVNNRMLEHLMGGGDVESFTTLEHAGDAIPPGRLGEAVLDAARSCVEPIVEACRTFGGPGTESELVQIDVLLPSGSRLIGTVRDDRGRDENGSRPGPMEITVSEQKTKDLLSSWLNLLALTAARPERRWRAMQISKGTSGSVKGPGARVAEFSFSEDEPANGATLAVEILDRLVGFCRAGRHEAIPFFPATSLTLYNGKPKASEWRREYEGGVGGDSTDIWVRTAFDGATFDEITAIPVDASDPEGEADDRTGRYAEVIWGDYERSAPADKTTLR